MRRGETAVSTPPHHPPSDAIPDGIATCLSILNVLTSNGENPLSPMVKNLTNSCILCRMSKVLIVEDDAFARNGIQTYLESLGYMTAEAENVQKGWEMAVEWQPETAVIDIRLPLDHSHTGPTVEPHGIALALRLKKAFPTLPIVLLSAHEKYEQEVIQMARRHVRGIAFLHKGGDMTRLHSAIVEVQAGRAVFNRSIVNKYVVETAVSSQFGEEERPYINQAVAEFPTLSPREQEIAHLIAAAHTPQSVAAHLHLSQSSVENRITHIYQKLGLTTMKTDNPTLRKLPILVKACLIYDIKRCK